MRIHRRAGKGAIVGRGRVRHSSGTAHTDAGIVHLRSDKGGADLWLAVGPTRLRSQMRKLSCTPPDPPNMSHTSFIHPLLTSQSCLDIGGIRGVDSVWIRGQKISIWSELNGLPRDRMAHVLSDTPGSP